MRMHDLLETSTPEINTANKAQLTCSNIRKQGSKNTVNIIMELPWIIYLEPRWQGTVDMLY